MHSAVQRLPYCTAVPCCQERYCIATNYVLKMTDAFHTTSSHYPLQHTSLNARIWLELALTNLWVSECSKICSLFCGIYDMQNTDHVMPYHATIPYPSIDTPIRC
jgi:hypothetical protein